MLSTQGAFTNRMLQGNGNVAATLQQARVNTLTTNGVLPKAPTTGVMQSTTMGAAGVRQAAPTTGGVYQSQQQQQPVAVQQQPTVTQQQQAVVPKGDLFNMGTENSAPITEQNSINAAAARSKGQPEPTPITEQAAAAGAMPGAAVTSGSYPSAVPGATAPRAVTAAAGG
eukprot:688689-Amorphochlora_amoeboformis.AAC.1